MPLQLKVIFDPPLSKSFEVEEPKLLAIGSDVISVPDEEIGKVQGYFLDVFHLAELLNNKVLINPINNRSLASFQFYSGGVSVTSVNSSK